MCAYLGEAHSNAARLHQVDWEYWELERGVHLPQSGAELPEFVVALLPTAIRGNGLGTTELSYVLDAFFRHLTAGCSRDKDTRHSVSSQQILDAVYLSRVLSEARFTRFKALFENHLPIIAVSFRFDKPTFAKPWTLLAADYLDGTNWQLKWTPPASKSLKRAREPCEQVANQ